MLIKVAFVCLLCVSVNAKQIFENNSSFGYDPSELLSRILPANLTQPRAGYGLIKFEDQFELDHTPFDDQDQVAIKKPFKFEGQETNPEQYPNDASIRFENQDYDSNNIRYGYQIGNSNGDIRYEDTNQGPAENSNNNQNGYGYQTGSKPNGNKKKRKRRKPKQIPVQPGYINPGYPGPIGPQPGPVQGFGPNNFQPGFNGQYYRPPRRPRPSMATEALSAVTGALTSIAENDDYQCVARLLCEAASGGALGGSSLLESVAGLQPLLTLLSAYNGISSNPLFVFGRAAFLGISSKNNPGSCRYAYPLCPTDPEQLVHYLNNHNGGFFRFFSSPQPGQQNIEQFYNQLSNYGLYQLHPGPNQEHYGLLNPGQFPNYGQQPLYPNGYPQNYGLAFPYDQNYNGNGIRFKSKDTNDENVKLYDGGNRIEKRIQNKPERFLDESSDEHSSKWLFPGDDDDENEASTIGIQYINYDDFKVSDNRKGKTLKFPDTLKTYNVQDYHRIPDKEPEREPKGISFPESVNNKENNYNYYATYPVYNNDDNFVFNNVKRGVRNNYNQVNYYGKNDHQMNNYYTKKDDHESGVTTVYVVRGNGDPRKPEIVKLRPGETL